MPKGWFLLRRFALLLLVLVILGGCASGRPTRTVRFSSPASQQEVAADASPETKPLRVAAASIISPQETIRSYGLFFAHLEKQVGRPIELLQRKTYEETYDLLRFGTLDLALVCTYVAVKGHDEIGLEVLAAPQVGGKAEYQSFIIVRADKGVGSFLELAGKRFAFTDPLSSSGRLYPLALLREMNADPGTFFASTTYTYSHDNSIKAVVQGVADGAAVDSLVYDQWVRRNPDLAISLKVIDRSPAMPSPPLVASKRLDPALRESFRNAVLSMHETPEGKKILADLGIDRFVPLRMEDYEPVRQIARRAGVLK